MVTIFRPCTLGWGENTEKVDFELAARLFPFSWLSHFQKHKAQLWTTLGSAACRLVHYTKEILKNTKEKSGNRIFQLLALETIL